MANSFPWHFGDSVPRQLDVPNLWSNDRPVLE